MKKNNLSMGMALGIAAGSIVGILLDNAGAWIAIGLALGAGIGGRLDKLKKQKDSQS